MPQSPTLNTFAWMEFLRDYEKTDPEPLLQTVVKNRFLAGDGYVSREVDEHIHWQRRVSSAWAILLAAA